jgi:ATP-dependent exoDNAse (exonuclease V) beta subunit
VLAAVPPSVAVAEPGGGEDEAGGAGAGAGGEALAADVGTLVHAYLEMIARDGLDAWPAARIDGLDRAMATWLGQRGHGERAAREGARAAGAALRTTLDSADGRWVLAARAGAAAELALTAAGEGGIATHVIDRTFVEDGVRWIVDYKTAKVGAGETPGGDLRQHAERYRAQLERYAALFRDEGVPVRMAVFYAASGRLVELAGS